MPSSLLAFPNWRTKNRMLSWCGLLSKKKSFLSISKKSRLNSKGSLSAVSLQLNTQKCFRCSRGFPTTVMKNKHPRSLTHSPYPVFHPHLPSPFPPLFVLRFYSYGYGLPIGLQQESKLLYCYNVVYTQKNMTQKGDTDEKTRFVRSQDATSLAEKKRPKQKNKTILVDGLSWLSCCSSSGLENQAKGHSNGWNTHNLCFYRKEILQPMREQRLSLYDYQHTQFMRYVPRGCLQSRAMITTEKWKLKHTETSKVFFCFLIIFLNFFVWIPQHGW